MTSSLSPPMTPQSRYCFFLSHANGGALILDDDMDTYVRTFFWDLHEAVQRVRHHDSTIDPGFSDFLVLPGADVRTECMLALNSAHVFLPLYSPHYLQRAWPMGELESFRLREALAFSGAPSHVVPIRWVPIRDPIRPDPTELPLWADGVPNYATDGLYALCRFEAYRSAYREIVQRLAEAVVDLAQRAPLALDSAPVRLRRAVVVSDAAFVVAVISADPTDQSSGAWGGASTSWRPFGQADPLAEHAADIAERLSWPATIVDLRLGPPSPHAPQIALIDPWVLAGANGRAVLADALKRLPEWCIPVVVTDERDPQSGSVVAGYERQATELVQVIRGTVRPPIRSFQEFGHALPKLIVAALRKRLGRGPVDPPNHPPSLSERRPRLSGPPPTP